MVRGVRRERALAERRRAERILRNRIHSLKRLRGFLCANKKLSKLRRTIRMRIVGGLPIGILNNRIRRARRLLAREVALVRNLQYIMVSTIPEMRTLVDLHRDFGWNGLVSVDPRATRFTRYEVRRMAVEESIGFDNYRP